MLGGTTDLTRGRLLARNVALNVAGWALPAMCALAAIPALVRGMGAERFGILALAWTLVGAFSPFDMGIGRALTQALSERVGREDQTDSPDLVWSALWLLLGVGALGALGLAVAAAPLAARWLHLSVALQPETRCALRWLALAVPLTTLTSGLRGVLEAGQSFRVVNALRTPLTLLSFAGPWAMQPFSHALPASIAVLVGTRALVCVLHAAAVANRYPALRRVRVARARAIGSLWRVAGWMTLSTLANPVLATGDRLMIGAVLPMAAFAQYAAVSEVASKLSVIGAVLQPVLLPALAATLISNPSRALRMFDRGARVAAFAAAPAALVLVAFAPEGLRAWLGGEVVRSATPVLRLLAIAWYVNACAQIPYVALQSAGRADVPAKFHVVEVPLHLVTLWLLLGRFGLLGAAIAGALRIVVDAAGLYAATPAVIPNAGRVVRRAAGLAFGGAVALAVCAVAGSFPARLAVVAVALAAFAYGAHRWLITPEERGIARTWAAERLGRPAVGATAAVETA